MKNYLVIIIAVLLLTLFTTNVSAITYPLNMSHGVAAGTNDAVTGWQGFQIRTNVSSLQITRIYNQAGTNPTKFAVFNSSYHAICVNTTETTLTNGACILPYAGFYWVATGSDGASYTRSYSGTGQAYPFNSEVGIINNSLADAAFGAVTKGTQYSAVITPQIGSNDGRVRNIKAIQINEYVTPSNITTITVTLRNEVNNSNWPSSVSFSNITGSLTFSYFNITGTGYCVTLTGNGTSTNCTTGNGASTYYNVSNTTTITSSQSVITSTYQSIIELRSYRLFTNDSITTFNGTNGYATNQTTSGVIQIKALNTSNNILITVQGNYSKNTTCYGLLLQTTYCNITGIYDNIFTIGAKNSTSSINSFSVIMSNQTLGGTLYDISTTNGSIDFIGLQGYRYNFYVNSSNYAVQNVTIPANASTNRYNFTLLTENTFELRFYNETSEALLSGVNVSVMIIGDYFANNYTTTTGNLTVSFLTPDDYTIRYYIDADIPRDYYVTLNPQSYNNISLYIIDEDISTFYLPTVQDQNLITQSGATVKLLRYYISCNCYKTVEMAKTDEGGQAIVRVVPNTINYKFIIESGGYLLTTVPAKLVSDTGTYTIFKSSSYIIGEVNINYLSDSLTFNNDTNTFVYTWNDNTNTVTNACIIVTQYKNGQTTTVYNTCSAGSTGSIIYTVTDTNQTRYTATTYVKTNTEFSDGQRQYLTVDFIRTFQTWGLVGVFITLLVFLFLVFFNIDSGTEGIVITGTVAILLMSVIGFMSYAWESVIGIIIVAVIIMYKSRT